MNLLVVGSGGREHALVRKLAGDAPGATIYCAPGNPGTAQHGINVPIRPGDLPGLTRFAQAESIDLTVVGPEQPLADGLADAFIALGLPIFGPVAAAARLEASKAFSKRLMEECGVPTEPGPLPPNWNHQLSSKPPVWQVEKAPSCAQITPKPTQRSVT